MHIRKILPEDDPHIAQIIRDALAEFGLNIPGTVFTDPETDHLSLVYGEGKTVYFVAIDERQIIGGAGIGAIGNPELKICELQKMYLLPQARSKGTARLLFDQCMESAVNFGYEYCYLETSAALATAVKIYRHWGFEEIEENIGNTGHFSCEIKMIRKLVQET